MLGDDYEYEIIFEDPDSYSFTFMLDNEPENMLIDEDGLITWSPDNTGLYGPIIITVTDDTNEIGIQEFYIDVRFPQNFLLHEGSNLISYMGVLEDNSIENMLSTLSSASQIITENYASVLLDD